MIRTFYEGERLRVDEYEGHTVDIGCTDTYPEDPLCLNRLEVIELIAALKSWLDDESARGT